MLAAQVQLQLLRVAGNKSLTATPLTAAAVPLVTVMV